MTSAIDYTELTQAIKTWGRELGFADIRIADANLTHTESGLQAWLDAGRHGEMEYMASHGMLRARPAELVPGAQRVIIARMDYLPRQTEIATQSTAGSSAPNPTLPQRERVRTEGEKAGRFSPSNGNDNWREHEEARLQDTSAAAISLYARGRDYHRVLRSRLQHLADRMVERVGDFSYRVFTDSAPVMEVALAQQSGLGWRGKHTLLLHREAGSMFFLGEMLLDLPLPVDAPDAPHCGTCRACIDICPTQAIVAPYQLDARRCISYLTIELKGSIPLEFRPLMGNRIYGCDDCQLVCPWNRFAKTAVLSDFDVRNGLDGAGLIELFAWSEEDFNRRLEGSPIRRIGHERWLRNIAVAMGNALCKGGAADTAAMVAALHARAEHPSALVREHVAWALAQKHILP